MQKNSEDKITARTKYILKLLNAEKGDRVLNIGISNIPEIEIELEKRNIESTTIDIDEKKLDYASKFLKKTRLIKSDIMKSFPFKDNYFDKVIILEVLEHLDNDEMAVREIWRILKPGGIIIAAVPNKNILHYLNPVKYIEHKRHYSNNDIIKLMERNNFRIKDLNVVEDWTLLANLYLHLFNKFVLRKPKPFHFLSKFAAKTYERKNRNGMDIVIRAEKSV